MRTASHEDNFDTDDDEGESLNFCVYVHAFVMYVHVFKYVCN